MLLRGQLSQVREILQTFWRPGQEKPFIFVQTLYSEGQRGSQRLSLEWVCYTVRTNFIDLLEHTPLTEGFF